MKISDLPEVTLLRDRLKAVNEALVGWNWALVQRSAFIKGSQFMIDDDARRAMSAAFVNFLDQERQALMIDLRKLGVELE